MRYLKAVGLISFLLCAPEAALWAQTELAACLEKGKKEFAARDYLSARVTFDRCIKLDQNDVDAHLSLAGVLLTQDDLNAAQTHFLAALKNMKRSSPYLSYTYSMLGDIALKKQDNKTALAYYNRSLRFNEANVNSLVGKGVVTETQGDKKAAAQFYKTALAVEPLNLIARKRLVALEPLFFTDAEMLDALKQRYAALPDKTALSAADRELFGKIHAAEQRGGIEYLRGKYQRLPADYVVTLFKDTGFEREVLTLSGYNALQKQIGQDAIAVFQKIGVRVRDVFDLRDMKGNKIFLADSTLTDSGVFVYTEALQGRKAFLLPSEAVPPTQQYLEKAARRVKELEDNGYIEISRTELAVIKKQTDCSEETLRRRMGLYVLPLTKNDKRYFVLSRETGDSKQGVPYYYVQLFRRRQNPQAQVPHNSFVDQYAYANFKVCSEATGDLWTVY